jgi:hypothetical protein
MSQLEVAQCSSPLYSFTLPAMVAGIVTTTNVSANNASIYSYFGNCSKVVGIVRSTSGGGGSTKQFLTVRPTVACSVPANGYIPILELTANNVTDTSIYTVYWTNAVGVSNNVTLLPC